MKLVRKQIAQLMTALNRINCCYAVCAQSAALKDNELMILYALADGVPYSQKQICDEWDIPRTTMNTIIKDWEKKGLVSLSPIPGKRREMNILLTESGQKLADSVLDKIIEMENAAMQETVEEFSPEFIRAIRSYEVRLRAHCKRIFGITPTVPFSPKE